MGIAFLRTGLIPTRTVLPASVMTSLDLRLSLVQGMIALLGNGAAALKSCLSPLEIRSPTPAGGWLIPRRYNFYSDEDHLLHATFLVLLDQRDIFEDLNFIRVVLQYFWMGKQPASPLLAEGH